MQKTDDLLAALTERIVKQSQGPRVIMGDFNCHSNLPQFDVWRAHGFTEIQTLAFERWRQPIQATYRQKTVIDQVWVSADLAHLGTKVEVDNTYFAEHACRYAEFATIPKPDPCMVWRQPLSIQWDDMPPIEDVAVSLPEVDSPDFLPQLFHVFEIQADKQLRKSSAHGLLPQQLGRCQTTQAKLKQHQVAPVKRSRPGEIQIQYLGETFYHVQWCRQLRRIQSYARACQHDPSEPHKVIHLRQLWSAIRRANGFPRGFAHTWIHRGHASANAPKFLPKDPPPRQVAEVIMHDFHEEFKALETLLIRTRGKAAREARQANANLVYRDVAKPRALPVQTVVGAKVATVTDVDPDTWTIHYEPPDLDCQEIVRGPLGVLTTTRHVPGQITLSATPVIAVGDELIQNHFIGDRSAVAEAFEQLWHPMWNKHLHEPCNRWDQTLEAITQALPQQPVEMELPEITTDQWYHAVRSKKSRSATGPDGVARRDLLAMPQQFTAKLVQHVNLIEQGHASWHDSCLTGLIALVEKRQDASKPTDFRPICVLSFLYRTWTSIRAKQCLQWLDRIAPPTQCGNRPAASARNVWWKLAQYIELQQQNQDDLAGIITDVVKCFNTLPRTVIAFCSRRLGLPANLVHSWHHAIARISRRFVISGSVSRGITACTGYPEGDAMSVVAMAVLNVAMHSTVSQSLTSARVTSYVDNWEAITTDTAELPTVAAAFQGFAQQVDIKLDNAKTETWSLTTAGRKALKKQGFSVVLAARDLGGQMVYSRKPCTATIRARLQQNANFWDWMARSAAKPSLKMRLLHTVAWPRCLHGISNHSLANAHLQQLRIAAMSALRWNKKGANSVLQFGLDRDMRADPGFFCLQTAVSDFRALHDPEIAFPLLNRMAWDVKCPTAPGPCKALLDRLNAIAWTWVGNGYVRDHEGLEWHLVDSANQWVKLRLRQGWAKHVGGQVSTRHTFGGLQCVDIHLTHEGIENLTPIEQGFMRVIQNGTFFTQEMKHLAGMAPSPKCPFCDLDDNLARRQWHCEHFTDVRTSIDQEALTWVRDEPTCFVLRGWVVEHVCQQQFRAALHSLPDTIEDVCLPKQLPEGDLHFFTDGSCSNPETPGLRLGTWACTLADLTQHTFQTVSAGSIPGGLHTTIRAELCAMISAISAGISSGRRFSVWTDNESVYLKVKSFLCEGVTFLKPTTANHDLWNRCALLCQRAMTQGQFAAVIKVRSHEDPSVYPEVVERWAIDGNAHADKAADAHRDQLPHAVLLSWRLARERVCKARRMRDAMRQLITKVACKAVAAKPIVEAGMETEWQVQIARPEVPDLKDLSLFPLPALENLPKQPKRNTLGTHAARIYEWIQTLSRGDDIQPMWLCSHQLLIHFQGTTGLKGYHFNQKTNRWQSLEDEDDANFEFHKSANAFQAAVKCLMTTLKGPWQPQKHIPHGTAYRCWLNCTLINASGKLFRQIDDKMKERGATGIRSVTKAFKNWRTFCGELSP